MSWEVQIQEENTYLSIRAAGRYSLPNLSGLFDRVKGESEKRTYRGVILDVTRVAGTIPLADLYVLGKHCSQVWKLSPRIAIVYPEVGAYSLFENVARRRGVQVTVVPDQGAAMGWLKQSAATIPSA